MITISDLSKVYTTDTVETTALDRLNLSIEKGSFVAIKGPSGCGKSTLLHILGLMDTPTEGSYILNGTKTESLSITERDRLRRNTIGFVFQKFNLIDSLSVYENIELPLLYTGVAASERKDRIQKVLEKLEIANRKNHYPYQLSGGQQQRVAVARCIITDPLLILADEPTGNLDSLNGEQVMRIFQDLNAEGRTIVMVTHDDKYASYAQRIINLHDGRIVVED
ncbi:MAG TPA: phosphonate ABC transporter ATP-binding protein [Candidatus Cloacimonas sp.]|nr:phosphonate ABC transporter ATP-binding protein [Candidatus Cloacimonas sp.]